MSDHKRDELYQVKKFIPELLDAKTYTLTQPDPPLPDIVIEVNNRRIGIEITYLILNMQARQRESAQLAIINEAQKLFEERHQLPLHVGVSFEEEADWKKVNRQQVAVFLAETIGQWVLSIRDIPQYQTQFDMKSDGLIHEYIHDIDVHFLSKFNLPCWYSSAGLCVPAIPAEAVQSIISRKNKNINGYLTGCDEVWLLMIETGYPSSDFDHYEELDKLNFESGFARTLIGRVSKGEVVELRTNPNQ